MMTTEERQGDRQMLRHAMDRVFLIIVEWQVNGKPH